MGRDGGATPRALRGGRPRRRISRPRAVPSRPGSAAGDEARV